MKHWRLLLVVPAIVVAYALAPEGATRTLLPWRNGLGGQGGWTTVVEPTGSPDLPALVALAVGAFVLLYLLSLAVAKLSASRWSR